MECTRKAWRILLVFVVVFGFGILVVPTARAVTISDGQLVGACVGWPTPHIEIRWSANPPSGSLPPNSNSVLRDVNATGNQWFFGGGAPGVYATRIDGSVATPYGAGGYPNPNYTVYDLRDDSVTASATYSYKAKYRPETPSTTYAVTVNATNCGVLPPTPGPLTVGPNFQTASPNVTAILTATGGDGSYIWSAPTGAISGTGSIVSVLFTNDLTTSVYKTVTVQSGTQTATATVQVDGVQTFRDDIALSGHGTRFVLINDDAPVASSSDVLLTLAHGFAAEATVSITVKLGNTAASASAAIEVPFQKNLPWNLCSGLPSCVDGMYTVYAIYRTPNGTSSPMVQDNIVYLKNAGTDVPAVIINGGAATTANRFVTLALAHGLKGIPVDEITMQIANAKELLDSAKATLYSPSLVGWDVCAGIGPTCANGAKTVYAKYCAGKTCTIVVLDDIALSMVACKPRPACLDITPACKPPEPEGGWCPAPSPTPTPKPTPICKPRPACLDATPACKPPEPQGGWCPAPSPKPTLTPTPSASASPSVTPSIGPSPVGSPPPPVFIQSLSDAIEPISVASAVAVGVSAIVALIPILGSSGAAAFLWQGFMSMLGLLPKRKKVWGTVYDANTKRPIPFAKVQLMDRNKRVLETHIADKDGRYGFLTTPESLMAQNVQISILPDAKGYLFPSHTAASVDSFVYNNLYYGELITVSDQTLINFDIPMDPVRPSVAPLVMKSPSIVLGASVAAIADAGFWLGLIMIPLNVIISPNPFSFGVLFLFLGTASLRIWGINEHPFGTVTDSATGRPMPFALITLNDLSGKRVGFTVTDEQGRYFLVADRGTYEMTLFTPSSVIPTRQTKQIIEARKGWITRGIRI